MNEDPFNGKRVIHNYTVDFDTNCELKTLKCQHVDCQIEFQAYSNYARYCSNRCRKVCNDEFKRSVGISWRN